MTQKKVLNTEFEAPEASPGFLLWQISNRWQAKQRRALATYNLTHVQFVLMATLTWASGRQPLTQKQLAEIAKTDVMMTSQVVRTLENKKLLERAASPKDARSRLLQPTSKGVELVNKAIVAVEEVDRRFFVVLGDDLAGFIKMMQQLVD